MEFDKLNFNNGDVLYAKDLMTIVTKIKQLEENLNTVINSSQSGGEQPTYDYTFEFYGSNYNLLIRKYLDGKVWRDKVIPYYESVSTMERALQEKHLCTSFDLNVTFQERTSDNNFTANGNPKYIRCGTNIQNNNWKLPEGNRVGYGKGSFDYLRNNLSWNEGLKLDQNGSSHNPPTEFEVYANINYDNKGGIYKIGDYESYMDGINPNVAYWGGGMQLVKAVRTTLTATVDGVSTPYTNDVDVSVAKDNVLMQGFTVYRSSELDWSKFVDLTTTEIVDGKEQLKYGPGMKFGDKFDVLRWERIYLSNTEYYPDYTNDFYRGWAQYFKRSAHSAYSFLENGKITLNVGDIFIYFRKKDDIVSTRVNPSALVYIDDVFMNPADYGLGTSRLQFNALIDFAMYVAGNDLIGSDGNYYRNNDNLPNGVTTIPAWISYYDSPHHLPDGTIIGVADYVDNSKPTVYNSHLHTTEYTIPYEEWVIKPDGTKFYRYGGTDYEIMAFRANKKIVLDQIAF